MARDSKDMQYIAVDVGYGDTKVAFNGVEFKFPSAVARQKQASTNLDGANEDDVYQFNGRDYVVGERAVMNALTTRGADFIVKYGALLIYVACKKAGVDFTKPVKIATGLSVKNYEIREEFLETLEVINVGKDRLEPAEVRLYAQGRGILRDSGVNAPRVVVVDIGYNTLDFLYFENGKPNREVTHATDRGVNMIVTNIQALLQQKFSGMDFTEMEAKQVLRDGGIKLKGNFYNLKDITDEEIADYSEDTLSELRNKNAKIIDSADKVIFSGGGANFIESSAISGNFITSPSPYEYSNVRGYLKLLMES